jgi:hypothetical protein
MSLFAGLARLYIDFDRRLDEIDDRYFEEDYEDFVDFLSSRSTGQQK